MSKKEIYLLVLLLASFPLTSKSQQDYYQYSKPKPKYKMDIDLINEFEIGFHAGPAFTIGSTRSIAQYGQIYSLNVGWNNGKFYGGTEFNLRFWDEILNESKANQVDFTKKQFLWLLHMKWYIVKGDVQPFLGVGTDFLSIVEAIVNPKEDNYDDINYIEKDKFLNYNAWFVPTVGVRFKVRKHLFSELITSFDISDNYNSTRVQLGIIYQLQF